MSDIWGVVIPLIILVMLISTHKSSKIYGKTMWVRFPFEEKKEKKDKP